MGKKNDVIQSYLRDEKRFADLFNGVCFLGEQAIKAVNLSEASEYYVETEAEKPETGERGERLERFRDIKKLLHTGCTLRVLAVEGQNLVDYTMPFRCMQYDTMEYQKQINLLRKKNREMELKDKGQAPGSKWQLTQAEKLCGIRKADRLFPVFTICLYHGEDVWDGPRTLKDMMDFGSDNDNMSMLFADYPMKLYCINEETDFSVFHTELRELFTAMRYRNDREGLKKLLKEDEGYRHLDVDTVEAMSVLLNAPKIWEERSRYMQMNEDEEEEDYNMCQALQEWIDEERTAGIEQGIAQGIKALIEICGELGVPRELLISKVMQKFSVTEEKATEYMDQYFVS
ncbi:MAG: hypothetical protein ACI4TB_10680, partial [Lachnospiraceae bacterium]